MIKPVYNRHTAEKKKSDQDSLITSVGDVSEENINENDSGKDISKPDEDAEAPLDNVVGSDTNGRLQDKDLDGDLLNSETANLNEKVELNFNLTSLQNEQDKTGSRFCADQ